MRLFPSAIICLLFVLFSCEYFGDSQKKQIPLEGPIQLHPENPHYFLYKGKPLALITSAEHYGAVLNLEFDYQKYLETLSEEGMNYTRIFTGSYFEIPATSFGIKNNTLAPKPGNVITPWTNVVADLSGKAKFDLSSWNDAYFTRIKDFMRTAAEKDIIVELTLFSSIYRDEHWDISPQNPENNVNIADDISRFQAQTLNNGMLLSFQENFVRKMVRELNEFDNFFFEIQNEPWSDHTVPVYNLINKDELEENDWTTKADFADEDAMAWQEKIAQFIVDEESQLSKKHLIAQNYSNYKVPLPKVSDNISILNFHYAWPEAVAWNYHYNKVVGFDESGFAGSGDRVYRWQAWQFMLSGGGLFNNLDYSFYPGHEDGTGENNAPGGGSQTLRKQLKILSDYLHSFDLTHLHPVQDAVVRAPGLIPFVMTDDKGNFAVFARSVGTNQTILDLKTGAGTFHVQAINTITGDATDKKQLKAQDGILQIELFIPENELALKIEKI